MSNEITIEDSIDAVIELSKALLEARRNDGMIPLSQSELSGLLEKATANDLTKIKEGMKR